MTLYNVHLYREMRLYFPAITADTPEQSAKIAADKPTAEAEYTEDCDGENLAALIDVAGDDEFTQSTTIDFESDRLRKAAPELLEALQTLAEQAEEDCPAEYRTRHFVDALEQAHAVIAEATGPTARREASMTLSNQQRAIRCQQAITAYSDDDTCTNLVDFLADAMHFCHIHGHSFHDAIDTALMHYEAEINSDDIPDDLNHQQSTERNQP